MENMFKKGLILGSLLSTAALIGLAATTQGKELTEDVKEEIKPLAKKLKKHLVELKDINKEKFTEIAETVVEEYSKKNGLKDDAKKALTNALKNTWEKMEEAYKNSHLEEDELV